MRSVISLFLSRSLVVSAGFAALLSGCSFGMKMSASVPAATPSARSCGSDAECDSTRNEVCRAADGTGTPSGTSAAIPKGICIVPADRSGGQVYLEVRPTSGTDALAIQVGPVQLSNGQNQTITIPTPVTAQGLVSYHGLSRAVGGAKILFVSDPLIPGHSQTLSTTSVNDLPAQMGEFSRRVPQGAYFVTVVPPAQGGTTPPPEMPLGTGSVRITSQTDAIQLAVSNANELLRVTGTVRLLHGLTPAPAPGIEVAATRYRGNTMAPTRALLLAQPQTTDANGSFTLLFPGPLSPGFADKVSFQFAPDGYSGPLPTFSWNEPIDVVQAAAALNGAFPLPVADPVTVTGNVVDSSGSPLAGARVALRTKSDTEKASMSYLATATTLDDGTFSLQAFPGTYSAVAVPASLVASSSGASVGLCRPRTRPFVVGDHATSTSLVCEPGLVQFGQVLDASFAPAANVAVTAVRRPDDDMPDPIRFTTTTGSDGSFAVALASGTYDVAFEPAASMKLPFKAVRGIQVDAAHERPLLVVQLDATFELFGELLQDIDQTPVAANIDVYTVASGQATLVGHGVSGPDGKYSLVLPASSQ